MGRISPGDVRYRREWELTKRIAPPAADEFELSLFGPGYGECALIHLGQGRWIIVDSCLNVRTKEQPALQHLDSMNVNPEAVELVVATHWHADHVRGLAQVVQSCVNAKFIFSAAYCYEELLIAARQASTELITQHDVFRELHGAMEVLKIRQLGTYAIPGVETVSEGTQLLPGGSGAIVLALSPNALECQRARESLASRIVAGETGLTTIISPPEKNEGAVALWIELAGVSILLGSDLEEASAENRGWNAALDRLGPVNEAATIVKVPHHGGESGHSGRMWDEIVDAQAIGVLTPFNRRTEPLPTPSDQKRLRELTSSSYVTASNKPLQAVKPNDSLTREMRRRTVSLREAEGLPGRITVRGQLGSSTSNVNVTLNPPARKL